MAEEETVSGVKEKPIAELKQSQVYKLDELDSYKKLRSKRKRKAIARFVIWSLVILLMPFFVLSFVIITNPREGHNFFGFTFYICSSESMKGVFDVNDCVVVKKVRSQNDIKVGDDISFVRASDGQIVTHRIIATQKNENGETVYVTKGVHNQTADPNMVSFSDVVGKKVAVFSALGHVIMFFRTPAGIITFLTIMVALVFTFLFLYRRANDIRAVGVS